jgi:hypothetical protein
MRLQIVFVNYILPSAASRAYTFMDILRITQIAVPYLLQPPSVIAAYIKNHKYILDPFGGEGN